MGAQGSSPPPRETEAAGLQIRAQFLIIQVQGCLAYAAQDAHCIVHSSVQRVLT